MRGHCQARGDGIRIFPAPESLRSGSRMEQLRESVAGMPLAIEYKIIKHVVITWEIAIDTIEKILPARLEAVEVRPGVGLMSIGCLHFAAEQFGQDSPAFDEVGSVVHVRPDLSLKMPQPRFSFYSHAVWSNSEDFVAFEARRLFTPVAYVPSLRIEFSADGLGAKASDANGPILAARSTAPADTSSVTEIWGQLYNFKDHLYHGAWRWQGTRFEHMKPGDPGRPNRHAHFGDLDVSKIVGCYLQMFAEPGRQHYYRNYEVRRLR
jgi:hypothetical protein